MDVWNLGLNRTSGSWGLKWTSENGIELCVRKLGVEVDVRKQEIAVEVRKL